jgi:hypothetical protein
MHDQLKQPEVKEKILILFKLVAADPDSESFVDLLLHVGQRDQRRRGVNQHWQRQLPGAHPENPN